MIDQYVTRTLQIVEVKAWRPTGAYLEDGSPEQECVGSAQAVVTRMNNKVAKDILRDEGIDYKGCQVVWNVLHIGTHAMQVEEFYCRSLKVQRAANGTLTFVD